mmetsp:Transcript_28355/g.77618  ORF Transcript_28355/g.77618 Transcript_28355/m.77618 type:complete len:231 (-) Transcript_28355:154-846(-)|eukprot:scaffold141973_cov31-Tisochrysis_lutea.AAC.1
MSYVHDEALGQHLKPEAEHACRLPQLHNLVPAKAAKALIIFWRQPPRCNDEGLVAVLMLDGVGTIAPQPTLAVCRAMPLREVTCAPAVARKDPRLPRLNRRPERVLALSRKARGVAGGGAALKGGDNQQRTLLRALPAQCAAAPLKAREESGARQEVDVEAEHELAVCHSKRGVAEGVDRVERSERRRLIVYHLIQLHPHTPCRELIDRRAECGERVRQFHSAPSPPIEC